MVNTPAARVLFTRAEAAKWFKVSESTIWQWGQRYGLMPVSRVTPFRYRFGELVKCDRLARAAGMGRPRKANVKVNSA